MSIRDLIAVRSRSPLVRGGVLKFECDGSFRISAEPPRERGSIEIEIHLVISSLS